MPETPMTESSKDYYSSGDTSFHTSTEQIDEEYTKMSSETEDKEGEFYGVLGSANSTTMDAAQAYSSFNDDNKSMDRYIFGTKGIRVLGLPLFYNYLDDPNQRVYKETFETDLPVVYIVPGVPKFNKKLTGNSGIWEKGAELFDSLMDILSTSISLFNVTNFNDLRFISFKTDYKSYFKYLESVLTFLHAEMNLEGLFKLSDWYNAVGAKSDGKKFNGMAFYLDKSTSISDSASNDYGASSLANEANQKAGQIREYKQFLGMGKNGGLVGKIATGVEEIITGMIESVPVLGGLVGSFGKTLQGSQLYYPDIWQNSTFSRSYTLSFKFYSPYGDPESIFKYVYLPTMALMCLSLPTMDGIYAYKQPFMVRMSCPGHFECECGAISSFDMTRSEDFLWTTEGFPNEIEISMTVQDLYPNLIMPKKVREIRYNGALISFLECMAGVRFDQFNLLGAIKRRSKIRLSRAYQVLSFEGLDNTFDQLKYNIGTSLANIFRY